jgi:phage terminase Nu1 subunit (DNA packaging protein)
MYTETINEEAGRPSALLTRRELARLCKVSTRTVDSWVAQKKVPVIRHSKRCVRFSWPEVISSFRSREEGSLG